MIRLSTTVVVVMLATVAAVVSYRHAFEVIVAHGETGFTAVLVPLTIDGLIFASSMVLLDSARRGLKVPWLARVALVLGIAATLAANVMHGIAHGPIGAVVAAWPAVALVVSYELLMGLIRRSANAAHGRDLVESVTAVTESATVGAVPTVEPESVTATPSQVHPLAVPSQVAAPTTLPNDAHGHHLEPSALDVEVQPETVPEPDPLYPVALSAFFSDVAQGSAPPVRAIKSRLGVGTDRARALQAGLRALIAEAAR